MVTFFSAIRFLFDNCLLLMTDSLFSGAASGHSFHVILWTSHYLRFVTFVKDFSIIYLLWNLLLIIVIASVFLNLKFGRLLRVRGKAKSILKALPLLFLLIITRTMIFLLIIWLVVLFLFRNWNQRFIVIFWCARSFCWNSLTDLFLTNLTHFSSKI